MTLVNGLRPATGPKLDFLALVMQGVVPIGYTKALFFADLHPFCVLYYVTKAAHQTAHLNHFPNYPSFDTDNQLIEGSDLTHNLHQSYKCLFTISILSSTIFGLKMSLCEACRKALPNIPTSGGNKDSIASISAILSDDGNWRRLQHPDSTESWIVRDPFPLHTSWESLVVSLSHDCPICWTLWRNIRSSPITAPSNLRITAFKADITRIICAPAGSLYSTNIRVMGHRLETKLFLFYIWKTTEKCYLGKKLYGFWNLLCRFY